MSKDIAKLGVKLLKERLNKIDSSNPENNDEIKSHTYCLDVLEKMLQADDEEWELLKEKLEDE